MSETPHRNRLRWLAWLAPGAGPLRRYLLLWLLVPQLVLWLGAAVLSYTVAARYANLALDRSLYQASRALARQVKPMGSGLLIDFPKAARDIIETDPDDRVYYMVSSPPGQLILGNQRLPEPPPEVSSPNGLGPVLDKPRFYDAMLKEREGAEQVRVVGLYRRAVQAGLPAEPGLGAGKAGVVGVAAGCVSQFVLEQDGLLEWAGPGALSRVHDDHVHEARAAYGAIVDACFQHGQNALKSLSSELDVDHGVVVPGLQGPWAPGWRVQSLRFSADVNSACVCMAALGEIGSLAGKVCSSASSSNWSSAPHEASSVLKRTIVNASGAVVREESIDTDVCTCCPTSVVTKVLRFLQAS